jgi:hypothetical protein
VNQARKARQLQRRLANPPDAKLIKALTTGSIQNTTVTAADVARATDIYGPSIEALKGRITATRALPFPEETMTRTTAEHLLRRWQRIRDHYRALNLLPHRKDRRPLSPPRPAHPPGYL